MCILQSYDSVTAATTMNIVSSTKSNVCTYALNIFRIMKHEPEQLRM